MARIALNRPDGTPRGFINESGGRKTITTPDGRPVGFYDIRANTTHYMSGQLYGRGNQLTALL